MTENHITIEATESSAKVTIGDKNITDILTGIVINLEAAEKPQVLLFLSPKILNIKADATINIDETTHTVLKNIGWTPPDPNGQPKIPELWTRKEAAAHLDVTTERVRQMAEENPESFIVAVQSGGDERQIEFYLADPIRSFGEIPRKRGRKPKK
jgi:hypothetical protein